MNCRSLPTPEGCGSIDVDPAAGRSTIDQEECMARYVDGFLLPILKKKVAAYKKISTAAGKVWREHGALEYRECVGEDIPTKFGISFPKRLKLKPGETVVFAWIVYKSKAHRDRVNAKVMKDPRIKLEGTKMPFDVKRMSYGGFDVLVDLT
jgi:uncharacterized protein YbaA (DUF1428 family)